jgi:hydrogenase maturation protein HypF
MLPYTPLHYLLMQELGEPIIATSGNISEEPMCIDEKEAFEKLSGIADYFLIHNRPIVRPVDDSIVRVIKQKPTILRRARGYAPLPISIRNAAEENFVCVGGHLKNTISMKKGNEVFVSQHIGDLENTEAEKYFCNTISDFKQMYKVNPDYLVHDLHPDYLSSKFCHQQKAKTIPVQHHLAHIAGCYEENNLEGKCFAVCWDGTGFGLDNTIWGGEFFIYDECEYLHLAQLRQFRLPGGDSAAKDTRRSLAGILYEMFGENIPVDKLCSSLSPNDLNIFIRMLKKNINCFTTSSAGRLFDAVSSLLNICQRSTYEGQAAMMLEFIADKQIKTFYDINFIEEERLIVNWQPMFEQMFIDLEKEISASEISAKFHNTLAEIITTLANRAAQRNVVLTGGCFQNVLLLELTIDRLTENGFTPHWNQKIPTNDGGISFGQAVFANHLIIKNKQSKLVKTESERV